MSTAKYTVEELEKAVQENFCISDVLRQLKIVPYGDNYKTIKKYIERLNLDTTHFKVKKRVFKNVQKRTLEDILVENSPVSRLSSLKSRLLKAGLLVNQCYECGLFEWQNKPIVLHLDHINGDNNDNRIENLRILCPNCHSQTATYCGKNMKNTNKVERNCVGCGKKVRDNTYRCMKCYKYHRLATSLKTKIEWPSKEVLLKMVEDSSYTQVGKTLGVTDNSVRKHLKMLEKREAIQIIK